MGAPASGWNARFAILGVAALSCMNLAIGAEPPAPAKLPSVRPSKQVLADRLREIRAKSREILQVQAEADGQLLGDIDDGMQVETKPPTREDLFSIGTEREFLRQIAEDRKSPKTVFMIPKPADVFLEPDSPVLGTLWYQNRRTGSAGDPQIRRGEMGVKNNQGIYPAGAKPEASILNQGVGTMDMEVQVQIWLGNAKNQFGIIFRAQAPDDPMRDRTDQIETNHFYYAVASGTEVKVGKRLNGMDTVISTSPPIPSKTDFVLRVRVYKDEITVQRDGVEVLKTSDKEIPEGEYIGLYGALAVGQPVLFDEFIGLHYGGEFMARQYLPSTTVFQGPSVHYQPLYLEQMPLERYGHHWGNLFQPWVSHSRFFVDVAMLPYSMTKSPPWTWHSGECLAKPGDIVLPFRIYYPVWDKQAVGVQTAVTVLSFALIP